MIEVQLPDGSIAKFPDGTPDATIESVLAAEFPAEKKPSALYENLVGHGEIDTPGERFGATIKDMGQSLISGVGTGTIGLLGLPARYGGVFDEKIYGLLGINPPKTANTDVIGQVDAQIAAAKHNPTTTAGEYAETIGEFLPGALFPGGSIPSMVVAGAGSELGGQLTEGTKAEPWARLAGAILAPSAVNTAANIGRRAITPNPTDPARLAFVDKMDDAGVSLTAGQKTGNEGLLYKEAATRVGKTLNEKQAQQFTAAVMKETGSTAKLATPEAMRETSKRLGAEFDALAAKNSITADSGLAVGVTKALDDYKNLTSKGNMAPLLKNAVSDVIRAFRSGVPLSGAKYQQLRADLGKAISGSDGALRTGAYEMRNALDDALERTLRAAGNTDDLARYAKVRSQYQNFLAVERAAAGAGEAAQYGVITPARLRSAVAQVAGKRAYTQGAKDIGELARAGVATMKELPQSGTAPRLGAMMGGGATTGTLGAMAAAAAGGGIPGIAMGAGVGGLLAAAPAVRNAALMARPVQSYLANQLMPGRNPLMQRGLLGGTAGALQGGR